MPEPPIKAELSLLLSKADVERLRALPRSLQWYTEGEPYLAVVSLDTRSLAQDLIRQLEEWLPTAKLENNLDRRGTNIKKLLDTWEQDAQPVILNTFAIEQPDHRLLAAQLLMHRDEILRRRLMLIVLLRKPLYRVMEREAFDFLFTASPVLMISDQAADIGDDLSRPEGKSISEVEYDRLKEEYEVIRKKKKPSVQRLLGSAMRLARAAVHNSLYDQADELAKEALQLARQASYREEEALMLGFLGLLQYYKGNYFNAKIHSQEALILHRELGDKENIARELVRSATALHTLNRNQEALKVLDEVMLIFAEHEYLHKGRADALNVSANIKIDTGDEQGAINDLQDALKLFRLVENQRSEAVALGNLGLIYQKLGEYDLALEHHQDALRLDRLYGNKEGEAVDLVNIGLIYRDQQEQEQALRYLKLASRIFEELGQSHHVRFVQNYIENIDRVKYYPSEYEELED